MQIRYFVDEIFNIDSNIDYHALYPDYKKYVKKFIDRFLTCLRNHNFSVKNLLYTDYFAIINIEREIFSLTSLNKEYINNF